ncbi:hypothetical protein Bca52824_072376 [Brassica carinata]|uniref:Uncharacterized protein n=1 Tax=Brassica carinata TaxID=52824 RepID=A0A8X7Q8C0_BRACI|nr:hypothetical protein Bca52824_072376 [Brassica carinata]
MTHGKPPKVLLDDLGSSPILTFLSGFQIVIFIEIAVSFTVSERYPDLITVTRRLASTIVTPSRADHPMEENIIGALSDMEIADQHDGEMMDCDVRNDDLLGLELTEMEDSKFAEPAKEAGRSADKSTRKMTNLSVKVVSAEGIQSGSAPGSSKVLAPSTLGISILTPPVSEQVTTPTNGEESSAGEAPAAESTKVEAEIRSRTSLIRLNTEREERGDLSGGKMCVGMEGSGEDERLGGGCGSDELRGGVRRQVSETWSSSP